jgi:hypothetical protein
VSAYELCAEGACAGDILQNFSKFLMLVATGLCMRLHGIRHTPGKNRDASMAEKYSVFYDGKLSPALRLIAKKLHFLASSAS